MKTLITLIILNFTFLTYSQETGEKNENQAEVVVPQYYRGPAIEPEVKETPQDSTQNFQMNPWEYYISMQKMMMQMMIAQQMAMQTTMIQMFWPQSPRVQAENSNKNNAPREENNNKSQPEIKVLPKKNVEDAEVKLI